MSEDNIVIFPFGKMEPSILLDKAKDWGLEEVLVMGLDKDGALISGSTHDEWRDLIYLLKIYGARLNYNMFGMEGE